MQRMKRYEKSIRARWGQTLAESNDGYTPIPNFLLDNYKKLGITDQELIFILEIMRYKYTVINPWPALTTIALSMGKSRRAVQYHASELEKKGLLRRVYRKNESNEWDLSPLIEAINNLYHQQKIAIPPGKKVQLVEQGVATEEDELRRKYNNGFNSIKEVINSPIKRHE